MSNLTVQRTQGEVDAIVIANLRAALKEALDMLDAIPPYLDVGDEGYQVTPEYYARRVLELRELLTGGGADLQAAEDYLAGHR